MGFTVAFRRSKSLRYPQVVELAKEYAERHEIDGRLHIAHFRDDQIDLVAAVYRLSQGFRECQYPVEGRSRDVFDTLFEHGYYVRDEALGFFPSRKRPPEYVPGYRLIRELISLSQFEKAVACYYDHLGAAPYYQPLHNELLYLKRLGRIELSGRDLIAFRPPSSRPPLIRDYLSEYVECVEEALGCWKARENSSMIGLFADDVPLFEDGVREFAPDDARVILGEQPADEAAYAIMMARLGTFAFPEGRLFDRYSNPLLGWKATRPWRNWRHGMPLPPFDPEAHPRRFEAAVGELLREGENFLRRRHGLPDIGEGWVSEMHLVDLIRELFPEALHHHSPAWLSPQHLDVYIPSRTLAFEYQGRQHYEPVIYFGGTEQLRAQQERDRRKRTLCKKHKVKLVEWRYDVDLTREALREVLLAVGEFPAA